VSSRTQLEDYRRIKAPVERAVERINARFSMGTAKPIHYRYAHLEPAELGMYYRMAEFAMVTSLQDGMNLVAKEFIASQVEQRGVLICSEFAGAAEALDNALLINPYDTESVADTLQHAIEMSCEEKAHRMARLQTHLADLAAFGIRHSTGCQKDHLNPYRNGIAFQRRLAWHHNRLQTRLLVC
jgi:trehalose-6-phosphate synthase